MCNASATDCSHNKYTYWLKWCLFNSPFFVIYVCLVGRPLQVTVRPMLRDHCLSWLSVCKTVTLMYCGQKVGWIKMPLDTIKLPHGTEVGLHPGNIVLDVDPASPPHGKGHSSPHFLAHVYCGQTVAHLRNCWARFYFGICVFVYRLKERSRSDTKTEELI